MEIEIFLIFFMSLKIKTGNNLKLYKIISINLKELHRRVYTLVKMINLNPLEEGEKYQKNSKKLKKKKS